MLLRLENMRDIGNKHMHMRVLSKWLCVSQSLRQTTDCIILEWNPINPMPNAWPILEQLTRCIHSIVPLPMVKITALNYKLAGPVSTKSNWISVFIENMHAIKCPLSMLAACVWHFGNSFKNACRHHHHIVIAYWCHY